MDSEPTGSQIWLMRLFAVSLLHVASFQETVCSMVTTSRINPNVNQGLKGGSVDLEALVGPIQTGAAAGAFGMTAAVPGADRPASEQMASQPAGCHAICKY